MVMTKHSSAILYMWDTFLKFQNSFKNHWFSALKRSHLVLFWIKCSEFIAAKYLDWPSPPSCFFFFFPLREFHFAERGLFIYSQGLFVFYEWAKNNHNFRLPSHTGKPLSGSITILQLFCRKLIGVTSIWLSSGRGSVQKCPSMCEWGKMAFSVV